MQYIKVIVVIEFLLVIGLSLYRAALAQQFKAQIVSRRAIAITLAVPFMAMLVGNPVVFFVLIVLTLATSAVSRAELVSTYGLMLPMMPLLSMKGQIGGLYLIPFSYLTAVNIGGLLGLAFLSPKARKPALYFDFLAIALIVIFVFIDSRDVSFTSILRSAVSSSILYGAPYLIVSRCLVGYPEARTLFLRLGMSAIVCSTVALFQTVRHWLLYQEFYQRLHIEMALGSATMAMRGGFLRNGGTMMDYTAGGLFLGSMLVTVVYSRFAFNKVGYIIVTSLLFMGLAATQLRGAWLAAALGFLFLFAYRRAWKSFFALCAAGIAAKTFLALASIASSRLAEIVGGKGQSLSTVDYRKRLLSQGIKEVWNHPVFGQSPDKLTSQLSDLEQGQHIVDFVNSHLFVAMASGFIGLTIWLAIWTSVLVKSWKLRPIFFKSRSAMEVPGFIVVVVMVALATTSMIDRNLTWAVLALGICGSGIGRVQATRSGKREIGEIEGGGSPKVAGRPLVGAASWAPR